METQNESPNKKPLYYSTQIVWYTLGVIETLLAFRFVLKIFDANPNAFFVSLIYGISDVLVIPFLGVFGTTEVETGVIEWTTLLAMLVYWIVAFGFIRLIYIGK